MRSVAGFRYLLRVPDGYYLGECGVPRRDGSEDDTFTAKQGRRFRIVTIDPAGILGAIHATWTLEPA